jgi:hypothetical protein
LYNVESRKQKVLSTFDSMSAEADESYGTITRERGISNGTSNNDRQEYSDSK